MAANKSGSTPDTLGNYNLLEKIGEGSMGKVYKGRHWETQQLVAIKIISPNIARNPVLLKRFEQEFRIASKLDHPNIVKAIEYCATGETPFLVMEFVEGESVGHILDHSGRIPEENAVHITVQVSQGLHRAHRQGLIHRDIKPDNIMVMPDGKAKILDLGLAKEVDGTNELTRPGSGLGTPNFMAPEQFRNAKNASVRCDVYSLGATLYMMVTGQVPYGEGDPVKILQRKLKNELLPPRQLVPSLSERIDWTIMRALSAAPEQRPASCREFAEDLIGRSTRASASPVTPDVDEWYMVFTDSAGQVHTASGAASALRRSLQQGQMGDVKQVRVSHSKDGPFELLENCPEFRDVLFAPAPGPPLSETSMKNLARLARGVPGDSFTPPMNPTEEESKPPLPSSGSGPWLPIPPDRPTPPPMGSLTVPPAAPENGQPPQPPKKTAEVELPTAGSPENSQPPQLPKKMVEVKLPTADSSMWKSVLLVVGTVIATLIVSRFFFDWLH